MSSAVQKLVGFWQRYENLNLKIAFVLISLQLIHLYWLTADVVIQRITGESILGVPHGSPLFHILHIIDYLKFCTRIASPTIHFVYTTMKEACKECTLAVNVGHSGVFTYLDY